MTAEIIKATDSESAVIEADAGFIVRQIEPGHGMTREQARAMAGDAAKSSGLTFGVFRVCEVAMPVMKVAEPLPSSALIARGDELRMRGMVNGVGT